MRGIELIKNYYNIVLLSRIRICFPRAAHPILHERKLIGNSQSQLRPPHLSCQSAAL